MLDSYSVSWACDVSVQQYLPGPGHAGLILCVVGLRIPECISLTSQSTRVWGWHGQEVREG
jgi:hypothetical protein